MTRHRNDARHPEARAGATLAALALLAAAVPAAAQAPDTDVWIVPLEGPAGAATNLTRRPGYDNQPAFTADGDSLLFTSIREDGQADTYRQSVPSGEARRLTRTPESEYSPTPLPAGGGLSVVRVERDSTQRLWAFGPEALEARLLLPNIAPVGYHAWSGPGTVVLYVLGEPPTLRVSELVAGTGRRVARDVGRSLQPVPGGRGVAFLQRGPPSTGAAVPEERGEAAAQAEAERAAEIRVLDPLSGETVRLAPALPGSEDFAFTPDGRLLMARDRVVHAFDPGPYSAWAPLLDLSAVVPGRITRLAVSPDGRTLAFVAAESAEP